MMEIITEKRIWKCWLSLLSIFFGGGKRDYFEDHFIITRHINSLASLFIAGKKAPLPVDDSHGFGKKKKAFTK